MRVRQVRRKAARFWTVRPPSSERLRITRESWIEAFTPDGRLIVSRRYDNPRFAPTPIGLGRWYRAEDHLLTSITILEPRFVEREEGSQ